MRQRISGHQGVRAPLTGGVRDCQTTPSHLLDRRPQLRALPNHRLSDRLNRDFVAGGHRANMTILTSKADPTRAHEIKLETKFWRYEISDLGRGYKISGKANRRCNDFPIFFSILVFLHSPTYDAHKASFLSVKDPRSRSPNKIGDEGVESHSKLRRN
jgi:hypothetical protein